MENPIKTTIYFDAEQKRLLELYCAIEQKSMAKVIRGLVAELIEKNRPMLSAVTKAVGKESEAQEDANLTTS